MVESTVRKINWEGGGIMDMVNVTIKVPLKAQKYIEMVSENTRVLALYLYPYIKDGQLTHQEVAKMLDMNEVELISYYGSFGIPYYDMSRDELKQDVQAIDKYLGGAI